MPCVDDFGIIDRDLTPGEVFVDYTPGEYGCVSIDDDYVNDWWDGLSGLKCYNMSLAQPQMGLSRWGITLLPPQSLSGFLAIIEGERRYRSDGQLRLLAQQVRRAIEKNRFMIHYGV